MNQFNKEEIKKLLPKKLHLTTSNGNFELRPSDCVVVPPQIQITYHHFTPDTTGDVLTDGEPDYLGFDIQPIEEESGRKCKVDITYGDAMMFSFDMFENSEVKMGHYNGINSKFDPKTEFYFQEETINNLIYFFNKLNGFNIKRDKFNFLDGDKNSYKVEKVNHRKIVDFKSFNPQGPL